VTFKVIRRQQAISNAIFHTDMHHSTRFQLTYSTLHSPSAIAEPLIAFVSERCHFRDTFNDIMDVG